MISQTSESQQSLSQQRQRRTLSQSMARGLDTLLSCAEELHQSQEDKFTTMSQESDVAIDLEEDLGQENDNEAALFNAICNRANGDEKMHILTNFYPDEIRELWQVVAPAVLGSEGRGRRAKYCGLD